ncbi:Na+/H+ antiporter subunit D [Cytobacillus oceanisediminis]|uniref:Na+/H+ antiporter subunit D n=1 Tax=Cytobacillus oceanisediminis TaxID=665099 RepID=UPI001CCB7EE1|nr:Na+/H+ antiporter subunit D [Cytobacillus oceanisediminis]MBZ9534625.1 Na+/H+ antiporter subunit D [Cytobacillus oceanisediminis]
MNNIVILPIILPIVFAMIMVIFRDKVMLHRVLSLVAIGSVFVVTVILIGQIKHAGIQSVQLGGWEAPFGVSMVADMFAAILVLVTSIVSFCCLLYAFHSIGEQREKYYFYPLFLILVTGVNGSFFTGDIFNLFVCFEVMLVASYVLISLGGTRVQLRESIKYILINIISSFLFLVAIAYLYAITGTLNFAHLSVRIAEVGQDGLMTTVAILFLVVFSLKAGLFLFFWLPGSYSAPPTAISAIFAALLTKVGMYAIIRVFTLIFYHEVQITHLLIGILAAITMTLGAIGAVAYRDIYKVMTYNVVIGVGFILAGLATYTTVGLTGSIYYFIHDMVIKALIFLLGGTIIHLTGTSKLDDMNGLIRLHPQLGWMFFIAALSLSGIPPLSGFLGKIFITQGTFTSEYYWLGAFGLISSLFVLYSIMKVFMSVFWGYTDLTLEQEKGTTKGLMLPIALLTFLTIALGLGTEGIHQYVDTAVEGLMNPHYYIEAILGNGK